MTEIFNKQTTKTLRRNLRTKLITSERLLWQKIRKKQLGYRFRRQVGIGRYVVDFYCPELKLVVEVDGACHETKKEVENDKIRQKYLERLDLTVKRYLNVDIKNNLSAVVADLYFVCNQLAAKPLPNPPLRKGRE